MWISTRDQARFGYLFLRRGKWKDRQLLSEAWIKRITTGTELKPTYCYMNWEINPDRKLYSHAPEDNLFAHGAGTNMIWVSPQHDLVGVVRWIDGKQINEFIRRVCAAVK